MENRFGVRSKIEGYMHETVATEVSAALSSFTASF